MGVVLTVGRAFSCFGVGVGHLLLEILTVDFIDLKKKTGFGTVAFRAMNRFDGSSVIDKMFETRRCFVERHIVSHPEAFPMLHFTWLVLVRCVCIHISTHCCTRMTMTDASYI